MRSKKTAAITHPQEKDNIRNFTYDGVFNHTTSQQKVYEITTFPILEAVFTGFNGTVFAYGQTGCGKTHSMMGFPNDEKEKGIIPRTFSHMLSIRKREKTISSPRILYRNLQ